MIPPGLVSATALSISLLCSSPSVARSPWRLVQATSGWRRIVPVAVHGASISVASNGAASKASALATTISASSRSRAEIGGEALQPLRRAIDRGNLRAGGGELRRSCRPARRRDRRPARPRATPMQTRRQAPPRRPAPTIRRRRSPAVRRSAHGSKAHRAGRQHDAAEPKRPTLGVALDGEVERRLVAMGARDCPRRLLAIGRAPALARAIAACRRRTDRRRATISSLARATLRSTALTSPAKGAAPGSAASRARRDRPRRGRAASRNRICAAAATSVHSSAPARRGSPFRGSAERLADRAEPAQRDRGDRARQRAVARVEPGEARIRLRRRRSARRAAAGMSARRRSPGRRRGAPPDRAPHRAAADGPRAARASKPPGRFAFNFNPARITRSRRMSEYRLKRRSARPRGRGLSRAAVTRVA